VTDDGDDLDEVGLEDEHDEQSDDDGGTYRFDNEGGENTSDVGFLTKLWGSSTPLQIIGVTPTSGVSAQVADVRMPEPLTCAVYFQAEFTGGAGTVQALTLNLHAGLGRTTVNRSLSFLGQPAPGNGLELTIPFLPMVNLLADVVVLGFAAPGSPEVVNGFPAFTLTLTLQAAPLNRAHFAQEMKSFGMSLPGEADELDNELERDLEPSVPAREIITTAEPSPGNRLIEQTIAALTQRLGRRPTKPEVRLALARMDARRARRQGAPPIPQRRLPDRTASPQRRAFVQQVIGILKMQLGRPPSKDELRAALASFEVPR